MLSDDAIVVTAIVAAFLVALIVGAVYWKVLFLRLITIQNVNKIIFRFTRIKNIYIKRN
jgi:hypothetical protein